MRDSFARSAPIYHFALQPTQYHSVSQPWPVPITVRGGGLAKFTFDGGIQFAHRRASTGPAIAKFGRLEEDAGMPQSIFIDNLLTKKHEVVRCLVR